MIKFENINLSFNKKKVFGNFNFSIDKGQKILINNNSGSGKTTLLKVALGLVKIDSGLIYVNKNSLNPTNINKVRSDIFYLDQDITLPELKVLNLIEEIFTFKENKNKKLDITILQKLLLDFKLKNEILDKNIKELSGGERQRVGLIIGFLLNRPIWFLDEPTSALDSELKEIVVNKIINLNITAIIISHDSVWGKLPTKNWEVS